MTSNVHFSAERDDWSTPPSLVRHMSRHYYAIMKHEIMFDVCATHSTARAQHYVTPEDGDDSLAMNWGESMDAIYETNCGMGDGAEGASLIMGWMNPPYGRGIGEWVEKAYTTGLGGSPILALLPARTDTRWFHDYVQKAYDIWFFDGRLYFDGHENAAPFPSMMALFLGDMADPGYRTIDARPFRAGRPVDYGLSRLRSRST